MEICFCLKGQKCSSKKWPTYYKKTQDCFVWGLDKKKYLDMTLMGVGTNILGYNNKYVDKKVLETINLGNLSTLNSPEEVELSHKLLSIHPWADKTHFTRSGGGKCSSSKNCKQQLSLKKLQFVDIMVGMTGIWQQILQQNV